MYLKLDLSVKCHLTKCHVSDVGYPLTVELLLFTQLYHSSSVHGAITLSINVHAQNIGTQKFLLRTS